MVHLRLYADELEAVQRMAARRRISRAQLVREAIDEYVERHWEDRPAVRLGSHGRMGCPRPPLDATVGERWTCPHCRAVLEAIKCWTVLDEPAKGSKE